MTQRRSSLSGFTVVGMLAALVHYVSAVGLQALAIASAPWANGIGFMLAFPVSYVGHRYWSFNGRHLAHRQTLPRLLIVSLSGFFANQFLLLSALHYWGGPFWLILAVVMGLVAGSLFLFSKYWVFK